MNLSYETDRLILRVLRPEQADNVLDFYKENMELFERNEAERPANFYTSSFQRATLMCEYNLMVKLQMVRFYVFRKENPDKIIGTIAFRNITKSVYQSCEVGYKFHQDYHRQGYATEALQLGISVIFDDLKLHRITASVMPENTASIALLEKLGFERVGLCRSYAFIRGQWQDHLQFARIHE